MKSPFPGMDPYIEACHLFEDFHSKLISEIERYLSAHVPDRYVVRTPERTYLAVAQAESGDMPRYFVPDVAVASRRGPKRIARKPKGSAQAAAGQMLSMPVLMRALVKSEYREPFIEIRQGDAEHKLVTGIEVLSPSNKRPNTKGWRLYQRKRLSFLSGHANLVEIDLLRGGRRMPMVSPWPDSPYYLLVCRKKQSHRCEAYPAYLTEPLPPIPIPLAPPDPDINLDIQPFVEAIYTRSRYERDIDYRHPLSPPLDSDEQAWLDERLRERANATPNR
jgi:hypothetical protein